MKRKYISKILALMLMTALLLSGCHNSRFDRFSNDETETTDNSHNSSHEDEIIHREHNGHDATFTEEQKAVQTEFEKFLTNVYVEAMSGSLVSTHFDLHNPEVFGITEFDSIWGGDFLESYQAALDEDKALYDELTTFEYSALTYEQQLIFDTLEAYLKNSFTLDEYYFFSEPFSPSSGAQFELNLILSEYSINDLDDIIDYLTVLESCDEYINELLEYEKWRADNGYAMTDSSIDDVISQCEDILSAADPAFLPVICDVIESCDFLGSAEKASYTSQIKTLTDENFIPAYESIVDTLKTIKGTRTVEGGLCNYDKGSEYYEALIRLYTGSGKSMNELIKTIDKQVDSYLLQYYNVMSNDPDITEKLDSELKYIATEPNEILSHLIKKLETDFPTPVCTDYELKYVAKSMESSSNPAFYLIPPFDDYTHNIIYVNNSEEYSHMDLFPLLAHEGMPGHMYQQNYFLSTNPHPIRTLMGFNGYAEGWAQYVEHYSYDWSGLDESVAKILQIDGIFSFALYSRVDIGVNYEGWDVTDIEDYLADYLTDVSFAAELYELFVNDPGVYLQYYVGNTEMLELKAMAMDALDDNFDIKAFHQFILEVGPTYFDIIEDRMNMWINESKK